jgi:chemotaxis protein methyltransferase CheR
VRPGGADFDIELQLLLDAIYLKYHYDFRGYAWRR